MNAEKNTTDQNQVNESDTVQRAAEQEGIWQQIRQHFQTTQTSLSLRLVCQGKEVQQIGDVKTGVREAARLFKLQDCPQQAEELIASQENLFNRKCQQWEQVAKSAEAKERAKATGGGAGSASSAANRRKLESANTAVRTQISSSKQCFRRLRTALNRGVSYGSQKNTSVVALNDVQPSVETEKKIAQPLNQDDQSAESTATEAVEVKPQKSRLLASLQHWVGDGLALEYRTAPFKDPLSDEGLRSREAIWTESQPYCLIVQWEDIQNGSLDLKFWIVPKRPEFVDELRSDDLPNLFFHKTESKIAERLKFELVVHNTQNGPLTSEMIQLLNRIESERFLSSESNSNAPLSYLTCSIKTEVDFDSAVQQSYLLELI